MITIMSPTKTFRDIEEGKVFELKALKFEQEIRELIKRLNEYDIQGLASLMKMSEALAEVNYKRNKYFHEEVFRAYPAILYYHGEAFKGLDADNLAEDSINFGEDHLRILSGLYGVLQPLDVIKEYRLEMATKLDCGMSKDLYSYWKDKLTAYFLEALEDTTGDKVLLNVASDEYAKAINWNKINQDFRSVTVVFKEQKGDAYKVIGTYAKKARGKLIHYLLEHQIDTLEEVKRFNEEGYRYNEQLSNENVITFTR